MPEAHTLLAGGRLLGSFGYASFGSAGWRVGQRVDVGGLTDDAVAEGARLIERLPWWPGEPLVAGADPAERPRRLAWLGDARLPRRFLLHTIHAENDASNRPDNNFSECVVVERGPEPPTVSSSPRDPDHGAPRDDPAAGARQVRPSQLWDLAHWAAPWGPDEVAAVRAHALAVTGLTSETDVLHVILEHPTGRARLRTLLALVHGALHAPRPGAPVVGRVDSLIWGAGLLDTAVSLLPERAVWDTTFDLRSLGPPPGLRDRTTGPFTPVVSLFASSHREPRTVDGVLDLTAEADPQALAAVRGPVDRLDCPVCGQWHASLDRLLAADGDAGPDELDQQLRVLREGERRGREHVPAARVGIHPPRSGPERGRADAAYVGSDPWSRTSVSHQQPVRHQPVGAPATRWAGMPAEGSEGDVRPRGDVIPDAGLPDLAAIDRLVDGLRTTRDRVAGQADPAQARSDLLALWYWARSMAKRQIDTLERAESARTADSGGAPDRQPLGGPPTHPRSDESQPR